MALPIINQIVYTLELPSNGQTIEFTPYTVKQEKNLLLAQESNNEQQVNNQIRKLIKECVITEGVNVDKLSVFDIELIFLNLRCKSVGENAKIAIKCPVKECEYPNEVDIDLSAVALTNPVATKEEHDIIVSEEQGIGVRVRYPTFIDVVNINKDVNTSAAYDLMISCITHIYTADEMFDCTKENRKDVEDFVGSLLASQYKPVVDFFDKLPTITLESKFTCEKCKHEYSDTIQGVSNFFT